MSRKTLIEKIRLDALTDGVFSVAMTLLVIDLRLPEAVHIQSASDLLHALVALEPQFIVYIISFFVLGLRWMSLARLDGTHGSVDDHYVGWALAHLFLITCIPFSTMVVGRFGGFAPAIWLYVANIVLSALLALRLASLAEKRNDRRDQEAAREDRFGLIVFLAVSALVVAASFVHPRYALLLYLINALVPKLWHPAKRTLHP